MTFSSSQQIVLASSNPGKIKEIQAILAGHPIIPQSAFNVAEAEETGSTFVEKCHYQSPKCGSALQAAVHSR